MKLQQESLQEKLAGKPFLSGLSRQVQQHWKRIFTEVCRSRGNWISVDEQLKLVEKIGRIGITKRRVHRESLPHAEPPYLPFALTVRMPAFSLE